MIDNLITFVRSHEKMLAALASKSMIDALTLRCQLLLHLPRLAIEGQLPSDVNLFREAERLKERLVEKQRPHATWLHGAETEISVDELDFVPLDEERAKVFHEHFHYVGSFRPGIHYALIHPASRKVACMGSVAEFDLHHAAEKIPVCLKSESVAVASRFFAFRWAPKNCFSFFWKRMARHLRATYRTELLMSFINPNIGFVGSSHLAAQWSLFALEEGPQYLYVDGNYRTARQLMREFKISSISALQNVMGTRLEFSTMAMHPLRLYAKPLSRRARHAIPSQPYIFSRPEPYIISRPEPVARLSSCEKLRDDLEVSRHALSDYCPTSNTSRSIASPMAR